MQCKYCGSELKAESEDQVCYPCRYKLEGVRLLKRECRFLLDRLSPEAQTYRKLYNALLKDIKEVCDVDRCLICKNDAPINRCDYDCKSCENRCKCGTCYNGSRFEWRGMKNVLQKR